ncbi:MAG: hypothetical protein ACK5N0_15850 [Synechococcaceae cyanobacterium]
MPKSAMLTSGFKLSGSSLFAYRSSAMKKAILAMVALPSLAAIAAAPAHANLVTNGGFVPNSTMVGSANSAFLGTSNNTILPGWKTSSNWVSNPNFWGAVVADGTAISVNMDQAQLGISAGWPQGNGTGLNTAYATSVASADLSGWFLSVDADVRFNNTLEQTINGLTPGNSYELSFYQAAGQYAPYPDANITAFWQVAFGSSTFQSNTISVASGAPVSAWQQQTTTFTANNTSQVLSFLTQGTPTGGPPFALLSGVSLRDITPPTQAPGPLPLAGVAVAFGASRTLRRRIKRG